jgi:hypothetical protein
METSFVNEFPCGCTGNGLSGSTNVTQPDCGCSGGLGDPQAPETQKDLISEAKKYINGEIPTSYKIVGGIALILLLTLATRGN